ncbi:hypothetical protein RJT34_11757 [Clitoria ternatea]|uniref:Uncharacterized protein n=1 Tax=Clitoria ternatea TaxID=43366 RepID=A0AAN9PJU5_CLITE
MQGKRRPMINHIEMVQRQLEEHDLDEHIQKLHEHHGRLDEIHEKLDELHGKLDEHDGKLEELDGKLEGELDWHDLDEHNVRLYEHHKKLDEHDERIHILENQDVMDGPGVQFLLGFKTAIQLFKILYPSLDISYEDTLKLAKDSCGPLTQNDSNSPMMVTNMIHICLNSKGG